MIDNPLHFPTASVVAKTVPKNAFYKRAKPQRATALKDFLTATFERITWLYKLHPDTLKLADGQQVHEIDVFLCTLKGASYDEQLLCELDTLMPRPTVYLMEYEGSFELLAQHKAPNGQGALLCSGRWERITKVDLSAQPLKLVGLDMDAVYAHMLGQLSQLGTQTEADYLSATELRLQAERLKKQCDALRRKKKQEKQYNLRLEISRTLKQQQAELAKIETAITTITNQTR